MSKIRNKTINIFCRVYNLSSRIKNTISVLLETKYTYLSHHSKWNEVYLFLCANETTVSTKSEIAYQITIENRKKKSYLLCSNDKDDVPCFVPSTNNLQKQFVDNAVSTPWQLQWG